MNVNRRGVHESFRVLPRSLVVGGASECSHMWHDRAGLCAEGTASRRAIFVGVDGKSLSMKPVRFSSARSVEHEAALVALSGASKCCNRHNSLWFLSVAL